jgi:hypothetical protein
MGLWAKSVVIVNSIGLDHGVGHPLLLLCHAKAPSYRKKKEFKDLANHSKRPKVADAVIEAIRWNLKFAMTTGVRSSWGWSGGGIRYLN